MLVQVSVLFEVRPIANKTKYIVTNILKQLLVRYIRSLAKLLGQLRHDLVNGGYQVSGDLKPKTSNPGKSARISTKLGSDVHSSNFEEIRVRLWGEGT